MIKRRKLLWQFKSPNLIYDTDFSELGWPHTPNEFAGYALCIFAVICFVVIAVTVLTTSSIVSVLAGYLFVLSIVLVSLVTDIFGIVDVENYVNREIEAGKWAEIHLKELSGFDIIQAKYAILQVRVRRLTIFLQILRAVPYIYLIFYSVVDTVRGGYVGSTDPSIFYFALALFIGLPIAILAIRYEPRWQLNTVAALGLALTLTVRDIRRAKVTGLMAVMVLRFVMLIILLTAWQLINSATHLAIDKAVETVLLILLMLPIVMFGLHAIIRLVALDRAIKLFE